MNAKRLILSVFALFLLFPQTAFSFPDGLYWVVEQYPDAFFPYNASAPRAGAEQAIDAACRLNPGQGTYAGSLLFMEQFPARKAAHCQIRRPPLPGLMPGNYYQAVLYCNGVLRDELNADPCPPPVPPAPAVDLQQNLGLPQEGVCSVE